MIPKRIYQTWKYHELPDGISLTIQDMKKLNPSYEFYMYDDADIDNFVNKYYPGEIANAYNMLNIGTAKADLWRYLILYKYGGIYLDIDSMITKSLDDLIMLDDDAIITRESHKNIFNQWILIFSEKHPILKATIDKCVYNIINKTSNNIWEVTGPGVFTSILNFNLQLSNSHTDI